MNTDDTQAPDSAPHPALNEQISTWARWFVDLRLGVLSEGQVVTLTGLDRVQVRELDDLFNQAIAFIQDLLGDPEINDALKDRAARMAAAPAGVRVVLFEKMTQEGFFPNGWRDPIPQSAFNRTSPPVDQSVLFLLDEDGTVGWGITRFDHDHAQPLCSAGSYYEVGGKIWEGPDPIGWLPIERALIELQSATAPQKTLAPEVKP